MARPPRQHGDRRARDPERRVAHGRRERRREAARPLRRSRRTGDVLLSRGELRRLPSRRPRRRRALVAARCGRARNARRFRLPRFAAIGLPDSHTWFVWLGSARLDQRGLTRSSLPKDSCAASGERRVFATVSARHPQGRSGLVGTTRGRWLVGQSTHLPGRYPNRVRTGEKRLPPRRRGRGTGVIGPARQSSFGAVKRRQESST